MDDLRTAEIGERLHSLVGQQASRRDRIESCIRWARRFTLLAVGALVIAVVLGVVAHRSQALSAAQALILSKIAHVSVLAAMTLAVLASNRALRASELALDNAMEAISLALDASANAIKAISLALEVSSKAFRAWSDASRVLADETQFLASIRGGESSACPWSPRAISSSTPAGPIVSKCASLSGVSAMDGSPCLVVETGGILHGAGAASEQEAAHG